MGMSSYIEHVLSPYKGQKPSLPLKKVFFYLSVSPARRAPPFSPSLSSMVFTPPSVPPLAGDRNPQGREDVAGDAIALPEFWYRQRSLCPQGAADICLRNRVAIFCRLAH